MAESASVAVYPWLEDGKWGDVQPVNTLGNLPVLPQDVGKQHAKAPKKEPTASDKGGATLVLGPVRTATTHTLSLIWWPAARHARIVPLAAL